MRLMEVDEAASHIKELVDPDANIIWGSAFNNDLGGRSAYRLSPRVSRPMPWPSRATGKVFTFPPRAAAPAPASEQQAAEQDSGEPASDEPDAGDDELFARQRRYPDHAGWSAAINRPKTRMTPTKPRSAAGGPCSNACRISPRRVQGGDRRGRNRVTRSDPIDNSALPESPKQPIPANIDE